MYDEPALTVTRSAHGHLVGSESSVNSAMGCFLHDGVCVSALEYGYRDLYEALAR